MNSELFPVNGVDESLVKLAEDYYEKILEHTDQSEFKHARKYITKLITLGKDNHYLPALISGYLRLAQQESDFSQHHQAIEHTLKALKLNRKLNNEHLTFEVYFSLGYCYAKAGDLEKSLEYSLKSLEYNRNSANVFNNIGAIYKEKQQYDLALQYFEKSQKIFADKGKDYLMSLTLINIGHIYIKIENPEHAIQVFKRALNIGRELKNNRVTCMAYNSLGGLYLSRKKYNKAEEVLYEALQIAEATQSNYLKSLCYDDFFRMYKERKDFEKALDYHIKYTEALEINSKNETKDKINKIHTRLEIEQKEQREKQQQLQKYQQEIEKKFHNLQTAYAEVTGVNNFGVFSDKMQNVVKMAELLHADRSVPVLIEGETGTGKEIVARIIHYGKLGDSRPFIILNCAAISPTLFESELFGYEEGAFTGSRKEGMVGKFELAQGGTIFLDEIGELPIELQPKLLRALQQKEIFRIGGKKPIKLDVRVICATNRDLKTEMEEKRFRNDLYFRLNTGRIFIPPLRERKEEIAPLAQMFLLSFSHLKKRDFQYIGQPALELLEHYLWPGNVRELENAVERATLLYNDYELKPNHLNFLELIDRNITPGREDAYLINFPEEGIRLSKINKEVIERIVQKFDGNKSKAANYLKIARNTVYNVTKK